MKLNSVLIIFLLAGFIACNNTPERPEPILPENYTPATPATTPGNPAAPTATEAAQNADGVWHYTCPSGCEGGAGSAVPCPKCGTTLAHNTAYHNTTGGNTTQTNVGKFEDGQLTTSPNDNVNITGSGTEPPQNADGVWHYTCPSGCAGGAGAAGPCPKCGATLAHNTAYHN